MGTGDEAASKDGSATTSGTTQENITGDNSVTIQALSSDGGNSEDNKVRRRLVTTHRRTLDYIQTDSFQNKRHEVPATQQRRRSGVVPKALGTIKENATSRTGSEWLEIFLPMTKWLKTYKWKESFLQDIIAGCTVGVMIVPQSMSYAKLAGLPVEYGLYSALMPVYAYSFFGSSRQLAVGPVALISLLLSTGLAHNLEKRGIVMDPENPEEYQNMYNKLAIQVSFLVGLMYIVLGILR